jgi:hypothetical protein
MPTPQYDGPSFEEDHQYDGDKLLYVEFFVQAVEDKPKSALEGRPIFREVPMVKIITPGSRDAMTTRATENYQRRFPKHWERFQKQLEQVMDGTPLDQVPWLTVGVIAELKGVNCFTLEQLAGMSDQLASKMMGMHGFRQKAKAFLDAASAAAPFTQMQAELEQRDVEIAVLKQQVSQLLANQAAAKAVATA